ncbi:hypothetical protein LH442_15355 [Laribacter hongkongensis]|uniref:hypothetical protein n=1 Tax=Laribacter hongkongensis TaxID=168471 RepID=UPI001EFEC238|nr:hypothetical protein [Laribacter hongkongensis]MCG9057314.1 hypothetical protein [Laribacter hongkongensis]
MNVQISLDEDLVEDVLKYGREKKISFDQAIYDLIKHSIDQLTFIVIDNDEIKKIVNDMILFAVTSSNNVVEVDQMFRTPELLIKLRDGDTNAWNKLHPSSRKAIGRQFSLAIRKHAREAEDGDFIIKFKDKSISNAALYAVTSKT